MGVTDFVLELLAAKAKIKGVFHWMFCCHGNQLHRVNNQNLFRSNSSFKQYHAPYIY